MPAEARAPSTAGRLVAWPVRGAVSAAGVMEPTVQVHSQPRLLSCLQMWFDGGNGDCGRSASTVTGMTQRDDAPMYQQVAAALRAQIKNLDLFPGQKLPSEEAIAKTYGVVRMTARRALDVLREEGLIVTTRGSGSVVRHEYATRDIPLDRYLAEVRNLVAGGLAEPPTLEVRVSTTVEQVPADDQVADVFGALRGALVLRRRRVVTWMQTPYVLMTSYYPLDLVAGTPIATDDAHVEGGIRDLAAIGVRVTAVEEAIHGRLPSKDEQVALKIVMPAAVTASTRRMFAEGRVVALSWDVVYPGDRVKLVSRVDLSGEWPPD